MTAVAAEPGLEPDAVAPDLARGGRAVAARAGGDLGARCARRCRPGGRGGVARPGRAGGRAGPCRVSEGQAYEKAAKLHLEWKPPPTTQADRALKVMEKPTEGQRLHRGDTI